MSKTSVLNICYMLLLFIWTICTFLESGIFIYPNSSMLPQRRALKNANHRSIARYATQ